MATAISTGAVLIVNRHHRAEADLIAIGYSRFLSQSGSGPGINRGSLEIASTLYNVGDGDCFRLRVTEPVDCNAGFEHGRALLPFVRAGTEVKFWFSLDVKDWNTAAATFTWVESPTRLKKERRMTMAVVDFMGDTPPEVPEPRFGQR